MHVTTIHHVGKMILDLSKQPTNPVNAAVWHLKQAIHPYTHFKAGKFPIHVIYHLKVHAQRIKMVIKF